MLVPPGVVTTTLAVPAVPAGVVAVIEVSLTTVNDVAAVPPMVTAVAPVKPVPVSVTLVPPAVLPLLGEIAVTVGVAACAITSACDACEPAASRNTVWPESALVPLSTLTATGTELFAVELLPSEP